MRAVVMGGLRGGGTLTLVALLAHSVAESISNVRRHGGTSTAARRLVVARSRDRWLGLDGIKAGIFVDRNDLATNEAATCITATPQTATITGTNRSVSASATLSCR